MSLNSYFLFFFSMLILAVSPGPGVAAVVGSSAKYGSKAALPMIFGIITGDIVFCLFAIFGLAFAADQFNTVFLFIKYLCGVYLIYKGAAVIYSAKNTSTPKPPKKIIGYFSGFGLTISNPKVIVFYAGFLPAFIDMRHISIYDIIIIMFTISLILFSVMLSYSKVTNLIIKKSNGLIMINYLSGFILSSVGLALLIMK